MHIRRKTKNRILITILILALLLTMIPSAAFADLYEEAKTEKIETVEENGSDEENASDETIQPEEETSSDETIPSDEEIKADEKSEEASEIEPVIETEESDEASDETIPEETKEEIAADPDTEGEADVEVIDEEAAVEDIQEDMEAEPAEDASAEETETERGKSLEGSSSEEQSADESAETVVPEEKTDAEMELFEEETIAPAIRPASASGKKIKIAMFGDSITWGTDGNRDPNVYPQVKNTIPMIIEDRLYVRCDNYGVGSMGWVKKIGEYGNAYNMLHSTDLSAYDVATLCFGVNDGKIEIGDYDSEDEETVMGQFNKCIKYLQRTYPKLTIIVIAPFPTVANQRKLMSKTINKACKNYGIGFISQNNGPLNEDTVSEALPDNVHPSQEYYYIISDWLANELQTMLGAVRRTDISSVKIKYSSLQYNGSARTQSKTTTVTGADGKTLVRNTDFKITYKNNTVVGKATITVTGKGHYRGTITKTFKITPKPTVTTSAVSQEKGKVLLKWRKQAVQTTGYKIQYSTDPNFKKNTAIFGIAKKDTKKKTISGLKSGKKYYFRIRTYKRKNGVIYYSPWSEARSVKAK